MINIGTSVSDHIVRIEEAAGKILLFLIIVLVFSAALLRWFGKPLTWSVDLAQLFFVWVCFIGADLAVQKHRHIGIDFFIRSFPSTLRKAIDLTGNLLILIFLGFIAFFSFKLAIMNPQRRFPGMNISYSWATASAGVGAVLMLRSVFWRLLSDLRRNNT